MTALSWRELKRLVYERAQGYCEYCQTSELNSGQTMQIDHIDPHGGDMLDNLCLSCWSCNNHKHRATTAIDPETGMLSHLFNPRTQTWHEHFAWLEDGILIVGLTSIGRATVARLKMNRETIVTARKRWVIYGYHPPNK